MPLPVLRCYGHRATTSSATSKQGNNVDVLWAHEYIAASQVYKHACACVAETLGLQLSAQAKLGLSVRRVRLRLCATSSGSSG